MTPTENLLTAIPTHIITGFLGAGKTTTILHLLKQKPANERWAVLVNEFGEIGVDGSLIQGQYDEHQEVYIREVPGGCMCCTSGLPMQIALNQLLTRAKPHRLLIEPTGLGHPIEILQTLSTDYYRDVLSIQKTVTLVDARKLDEPRYTGHQIFRQQIAIADLIVGNKQELYQPSHTVALEQLTKELAIPETEVLFTEQGQLPIEHLYGASAFIHHSRSEHHHHHPHSTNSSLETASIPESGYIRAENRGEGFQSTGWRFDPSKTFDRSKLFALLSGLTAERMKAVFITEEGVYGYNLSDGALTEIELDDCMESRIEIISEQTDPDWEGELLACLTAD